MTEFRFLFIEEENGDDLCDLIIEDNFIELNYDKKIAKNTIFLIKGNKVNTNEFMDFVVNYAEENPCEFYFDSEKKNYFQLVGNKFIINFDCNIRKEIIVNSNETGSQIFKQLNYFYYWCKCIIDSFQEYFYKLTC